MKHSYFPILLSLLLTILLLAGCETAVPVPTAEPTPSASPSAVVPETPTPSPAALPDAGLKEDNAEPEQVNEAYETAKSYIDRTLAELTEAVGEPLSSAYASSCLGPGRDGELRYDGFTVYTYDNGTTETILDVIAD